MANIEQMKMCYNCKQIAPKAQFHDEHYCDSCRSMLGPDAGSRLHIVVCEICGVEFSVFQRGQRFCSRKCASTYRTQNLVKPGMTLKCEVCGKIIPVGHRSKLTCSDECAAEREKRRRKNYANEWYKAGREDLETKTQHKKANKKKTRKETTASFTDIARLCAELHITYGVYQQLESTGRLQEYIEQARKHS